MAVEQKKGLIALKLFIRKLQTHMLRGCESCEETEANETVPDDVKEGHFAIVAKNEDGKPIRFVVDLCVLKHPKFLRLLKMAEEEYGFQQSGALAVPCRPEELRRILHDRIWRTVC